MASAPTNSNRDADFVAVFEKPKRSWKSYIWSTLDSPPEEARFLTKLDLTLITAAAYGVMNRYLDQVNIVNAFNSGMREDLSLYGNELNYAQSLWSVGYVIGQIPSNLILIRIPSAPLYIAFLEFAWTACTFGSAAVQKPAHIYGLRFLVGFFESGHFPAVMYIASSYYKPHELARRTGIIQVFTSVGPLFSGFMMAAVHAGLNGKGGLAGWRWMFIICGVVSLPSALWTAFALPQLPSRAKANWVFTEEDIQLSRLRMPTENKMMTGLFKWKDIKQWHTTWQAWLMPLYFIVLGQMGQSHQSMIYWLRSYNKPGQPQVYSITQINLLPLGINGIIIFGALIADWISDNLPGSARWPIMSFVSIWGIIFGIVLAATPVYPEVREIRMVLYYLTSLASIAGGVTWTMVNEVCRADAEKRAYVGALMNAISFAFGAWVPILTFPTSQQPVIITGNYVNAGWGAFRLAMSLLIAWFYRRDKLRAREAAALANQIENDPRAAVTEDVKQGGYSGGSTPVDEKAKGLPHLCPLETPGGLATLGR